MAVLSELARRLQPLGAMAESAGSMFGLRPFAAMLSSASQPAAPKPTAAIERIGNSRRQSPGSKEGRCRGRSPAKKAPATKKAASKKAPAASKKAAPRKR